MTSIYQLKFDSNGNILNNGQGKSITDLEQLVYNSVNDLYSTYVKYIRCTNNNSLSECSTIPTQDELEGKYNAANDSIIYFNNAITNIQKYISANQQTNQTNQNNDDLKMLMDNYNKVLQSRSDIDNKLDELIHTNTSYNSKTNIINTRYNDSIYAGVLLTAFASSLLYLLFFKMK
jgi:hypothetical protein